VPIYRAEEANGCAYFVMAFIEGENLAERVRDRGPLPAVEVVRLLREAAWGTGVRPPARGWCTATSRPRTSWWSAAAGARW
jgi:hypothetical protein